jgi:23S rRNA pseudouridine1911/1915/1917 synthase
LRFNFTIDEGQEPIRIDKFLVNRILKASRSKLQDAIEKKQVKVNGKPVKSSYKLRPKDKVDVWVDKEPSEFEIVPQDIPLAIVYEDDQLLVVNKPAGMVVHPGFGNLDGTLLNALAFHFDKEKFESDKRPWLVHRIDKNTSGLLVVAKNDDALVFLGNQFKAHTTERTYQALVWGCPTENEGTVNTLIGRDKYDRKKFTVYPDDEEVGKRAITHYKVLEDFLYTSLIECKLETGRTHQIRVHMKHLGHPLFNDDFYGGNKIRKGVVFSKYKQFVDNCFTILPRQALHAKTLGFIHPTTKDFMQFDSDLPQDIEDVLAKWRNVTSNQQF